LKGFLSTFCKLIDSEYLWSAKRIVGYIAGVIAKRLNLRFGLVNQNAIGHLAFDTEINFLEHKNQERGTRDFWYLVGNTANQTLTRLYMDDRPEGQN
jgi:hypothetical protein